MPASPARGSPPSRATACTIVMPEGMSDERKKIMRAYGAALVFTPGGESDVDLALARLRGDPGGGPGPLLGAGPVRQRRQYRGPYAHHRPRDLGADGRRAIGAFVDAAGQRRDADRRRPLSPLARRHACALYAVEPAECALLARREWGPHGIEGIGDGFVPRNLDVSLLTGVITTTTDESIDAARRLASAGRHLLRHLERLQRRRRAEARPRATPTSDRSSP